jgi:cardiolipin synthase
MQSYVFPKRLKRSKQDARLGYTSNEAVRLVRAGHEYFDLLDQLIAGARFTIHLQTYIFEEDETGKRVARALMEAARRKVKVYIIADGYASQNLSSAFVNQLREQGIYFRFFSSYFRSRYFYFGRRLHHKIVVVDSERSLVGGINIGNHYNDTTENVAWLDWAVYVQGEIGSRLQEICEKRIRNHVFTRTVRPPLPDHENRVRVRPRINDWVRRKREITQSYLEMFQSAQSHVTVISSYFIPGKELRKMIASATRRGVKVQVILAGISDVVIAKYAERFMYRWLLRNKVEVWEYQKRVLHAKLATYDDKWVTVGSYNLNNISAYASVELNLDIDDKGFAQDIGNRLNQIIESECIQITAEDFHKKQTLWEHFLQRSAYDIFRIILFLFTFYFKQRD